MNKTAFLAGTAIALCLAGISDSSSAASTSQSLAEMFSKGTFDGSLKSYYYTQTFDSNDIEDSEIWVNGGHLKYETASFYGVQLGAKFQASFVGSIDDDSGVTAGSMDADGTVLSEAYLQYALYKTQFKGGRQHMNLPLVADSGSRLIRESFEAYLLSNTDIPDTTVKAGWVSKYQTRTDRSSYADNWFVDFDENGSGKPGDFYDIGDDGMYIVYLKNSSLNNLEIQAQYGNVVDEVQGFYTDIRYTFGHDSKPFLAAQYYYSDFDDSEKDSNDLIGLKAGINVVGVDLFAAYTTTGGAAGDEATFRGVGQGAFYNFTTTTKTAGQPAFNADTDSYQLGLAYKTGGFKSMLRYTVFDQPEEDKDLDEYTLNLEYNFSGKLENLSFVIDYTYLDYEADDADSTDLRCKLIYAF